MKKRGLFSSPAFGNAAKNRPLRTGDHCPQNGLWSPSWKEEQAIYVAEGSLMPAHEGAPAYWYYVDTHPQFRCGPAAELIGSPKLTVGGTTAAVDASIPLQETQ